MLRSVAKSVKLASLHRRPRALQGTLTAAKGWLPCCTSTLTPQVLRIPENTTKLLKYRFFATVTTNNPDDSTSSSSSTNETILQSQPATTELLQTWADQHATLRSRLANTDALTEKDSKERNNILESIVHAAHQTHNVWDELHPQWSPRGHLHSDESSISSTGVEASRSVWSSLILSQWAETVKVVAKERSQIKIPMRGVPQRAQFLWEQLPPDIVTTEMTNSVLQIWAYSRQEHWPGTRAQSVWDRYPSFAPDGESYRLLLRAWAWSRERRGAFHATGYLRKMLRLLEHGNSEMEPYLEEYRIVLRAWIRARDLHAPTKAFAVVRILDYALNKGTTFVQLDTACYRSILLTASRRPQHRELGDLVDTVLKRMAEWFLVPDTTCYGGAIRTWKNVTLHPDNDRSERIRGAARALELLKQMDVAHQQSTSVTVRPTTRICNDALEALSTEPSHWLDEALALLSRMENEYAKALPNHTSYALILYMIQKSSTRRTEESKTQSAKDILDRYVVKYNSIAKIEPLGRPTVLNAFIHVCSSESVLSDNEGIARIRDILQIIESTRSSCGIVPDSETFAALLEVCRCLLLSAKEREAFADQMFRLCCIEGLVNEAVLQQYQQTVSSDHYFDVVVSNGVKLDDHRVVPEEWTRHALGGKVISADGRRTNPLSTKGKLVETKSMTEFRFRRINDKRKKTRMQGGRLPKPPRFGTIRPSY